MTYQIKAIFPLGRLSCGWGSAAIVRTTDSGHCSVMSGSRLALLAAGRLLAPAPSRSTGHEMLHAPAVLLESRVTPCCRAAFRGCCSQQQVHSGCRKQEIKQCSVCFMQRCEACRGSTQAVGTWPLVASRASIPGVSTGPRAPRAVSCWWEGALLGDTDCYVALV